MRCITFENGKLELNWMWLPTFIGQNYAVMREMEVEWEKRFGDMELLSTPETLDEIHRWAIDWLCEKFQIPGLKDYLLGMEKVPMEGNDVSVQS